MLSKKGVFSAMVGVAMLAMPASALAGHHDHDFKTRPYAEHDQGWHNGWSKHERGHDFRGFRPVNTRTVYYQPPVREVPPRRVAWNPEPYPPAPPPVRYHHIVVDDDCNWGGGYNYGQPMSYYNAYPPAGYASQQVAWLLERRQQAYLVLAKMRARHDSHAADRMLQVINNLNARIYALNHRGTNYSNSAYYNPPVNYGTPYAANALGNAYDPYGAGYNSAYPATNPALGALTGLVGPLLGMQYPY